MSLIGNNVLGMGTQGAIGRRAAGASTLCAPSFALQDTVYTNDMGPDGYNWPQGGPDGPLVIDQYGKLIAISEDAGGNHTFTYSNDGGATWADSALNLGFLTRGALAYNTLDDTLLVCWAAQAASDGILFRRYTISRDGSHNLTGFTAAGAGYTILDAETTGTMQYEHPCILWLSDLGAHGTVICAWCCRNTGLGGTGNEIRACMRQLTNSAADLLAINWIHLGVESTTTIGNAPTAISYTALLTNVTTGIPHAELLRLTNGDLFLAYHDGTVTGGVMAGNWAFRRATWDGSAWSALTPAATLSAVKRSGTDTGYARKGELLSKAVQDSAGNIYVGLATWKEDASGDTWAYAQITPADSVALVDVYSASGTHSYAPTGDLTYDTASGCLVVSYIKTTTQAAYARLYSGVNATQAEASMFDTAPVDIPLIRSGVLTNKLAALFRDTNTPHKGWFGTMTWG